MHTCSSDINAIDCLANGYSRQHFKQLVYHTHHPLSTVQYIGLVACSTFAKGKGLSALQRKQLCIHASYNTIFDTQIDLYQRQPHQELVNATCCDGPYMEAPGHIHQQIDLAPFLHRNWWNIEQKLEGLESRGGHLYVTCWSVCDWEQIFDWQKLCLNAWLFPSEALDQWILNGPKVKL